jgi:putative transcription antitermination factor YqgF
VLSRCTVFEFKSVTPEDVVPNIKRGFAFLEEETGIKIEYWDERLSTVAAERSLIEADVRRDKRKKVIDMLAAVIILQGYLDSKRIF